MKGVYLTIIASCVLEVVLLIFCVDIAKSMRLSLASYFLILSGCIYILSLTDNSTRVEKEKTKFQTKTNIKSWDLQNQR